MTQFTVLSIFCCVSAGLLFYANQSGLISRTNNNLRMTNITLIASIVFLILVVFGMNISNFNEYIRVIPNNIRSLDPVVIGQSRGIRSDEWLINVSGAFHDMNIQGHNIKSFSEWIIKYIVPYNWGYLFLPNSMAFSFATLSPYFVLLISGICFFKIFARKNILYALACGFILLFSPEIGWWNATHIYASFFSVIVLFYLFFQTDFLYKKVLYSIGLVLFICAFILNIYPAWQVPLFYLGAFILVGIYVQQKKINFKKHDLIYITAVLFAVGFVLFCYYIESKEFIKLVSETVYPGKRYSNGGNLPLSYLSHYLMVARFPFKDTTYLNNSEASAFISLFPVPFLLFILNKEEFKKHKILKAIFIFSIFCAVYMFIGFIPLFSKLTLFNYSVPYRLFTIFDLSLLLLLLLEVYYIKEQKGLSQIWYIFKTKGIVYNTTLLVFLYYVYKQQRSILEYLGLPLFIVICIIFFVLSNLAILGKKKMFIGILLFITFMSGFSINPLNLGTGVMESTPLAKEIRIIQKQDSGNWITLNDFILSKYVKAQGVECINALSYPPRFDLFHPIDPDRKYNDVYNRYAHVEVNLVEQPSSFELYQDDLFKVNLSLDDLDEWNVKYIITKEEVVVQSREFSTKVIYSDSLDGFKIYKVDYKKAGDDDDQKSQ